MKSNKYVYVVMLILIFVLTCGVSFAIEERNYKTKKYKITITNLTRSQIFSPPIVIAHDSKFSLFTLGEPASDQLAALAEGGATDPLVDLIDDRYPTAVFDGPIPPGHSESVVLKISKRNRARLISAAAMLVSTNDAFLAVRNAWFHGKRNINLKASAYDAGSEQNTEACKDIPGPPCGPNDHPDVEAEGYVHVHAGVHGTNPEGTAESDLIPAMHDWNNPVAKITIRRVYH